jgi:hypothetical protein
VALAQLVQPNLKAILLYIPERVSWDVSMFDGDEERKKYHLAKMLSKDSRPQAQLAALGLADSGTVLHIRYNGHGS